MSIIHGCGTAIVGIEAVIELPVGKFYLLSRLGWSTRSRSGESDDELDPVGLISIV